MKRLIFSAIGLMTVIMGLMVIMAASVMAQETPITATAAPTSPPRGTVTPQDLPSLSGVGGTPILSNVRIRVEPNLEARQMGILRFGKFIDIVGTNGFDPERGCSATFEDDLDMWVQVVFREQRGWVARCTLTIYGDMRPLPIEATPEAVG